MSTEPAAGPPNGRDSAHRVFFDSGADILRIRFVWRLPLRHIRRMADIYEGSRPRRIALALTVGAALIAYSLWYTGLAAYFLERHQ